MQFGTRAIPHSKRKIEWEAEVVFASEGTTSFSNLHPETKREKPDV